MAIIPALLNGQAIEAEKDVKYRISAAGMSGVSAKAHSVSHVGGREACSRDTPGKFLDKFGFSGESRGNARALHHVLGFILRYQDQLDHFFGNPGQVE